MKPTLIISFGNTISRLDPIDELAKIISRRKNDTSIMEEIHNLSYQIRKGNVYSKIGLRMQLQLLQFSTVELAELAGLVGQRPTKSFIESFEELKNISKEIVIVSGTFEEIIRPVLKQWGIEVNKIYAHSLEFDDEGICVGVDMNNPLFSDSGKARLVKQISLNRPAVVIGDDFTDYEIKHLGNAEAFIVYTEHFCNKEVMEKADFIAKNFKQVTEIVRKNWG